MQHPQRACRGLVGDSKRVLAETSVEAAAMVTAEGGGEGDGGSNGCSKCSGDGINDGGGRGNGDS